MQDLYTLGKRTTFGYKVLGWHSTCFMSDFFVRLDMIFL